MQWLSLLTMNFNDVAIVSINPKTTGGGEFDPRSGFSKNLSSKERLKQMIMFPENVIEIPQVFQKI